MDIKHLEWGAGQIQILACEFGQGSDKHLGKDSGRVKARV